MSVKGLTAQRNAFTSLSGLTFRWGIDKIDQLTTEKATLSKCQDSQIICNDYTYKAEANGYYTNKAIFTGLAPGTYDIKVLLEDYGYSLTDNQILTVYMDFDISPIATLMCGESVEFEIRLNEKNHPNCHKYS